MFKKRISGVAFWPAPGKCAFRAEEQGPKRQQREHVVQVHAVEALKQIGCRVFAVPNGRHFLRRLPKMVAIQLMAFLKMEGLQEGAPDLMVLVPGGAIVMVEMKAPTTYKISEKTGRRIVDKAGGRPSKEQIKFAEDCARGGWPYFVADSPQAAVEFVQKFLKRGTK